MLHLPVPFNREYMHADNDLKEIFLIREMKCGNEGAFDFFFKYYYPGLCVFAQRKINIPIDDAKNIVQDVFVKFWNDREKIDIKYSVRSYLFTSVKNKCLDFIKKSHYPDLRETFPENFSIGDEPYEIYVLSELQQLFNESLQKLPDRCRTIFELSRFEMKKNIEIATMLKISEKAVEKQITRALKILKRELHDYLPLMLFFEYFLFLK
jgi:RNA polymerase sigma-70 factor (ECF subfamily)